MRRASRLISISLILGCAPYWYIRPGEPIPVYESMEIRPGGARPAGVVIANLTQDDCVAVVGMHDDKDPTAYEIRLPNGERGWIFVVDVGNRVVSWETASSCTDP